MEIKTIQIIEKWQDVLEIVAKTRARGLITTNFYPNEQEMSEWIEKKSLYFLELGERSACIMHKTGDASFLFFFLKDYIDLSNSLLTVHNCLPKEIQAFDWIVRNENEQNLLKQQCLSGKFFLHTALRRMTLLLKENNYKDETSIGFAEDNDVEELYKLFFSAFNPISERIPTKDQLKKYICSKSILVNKKQEEIAGFAVIDIQKKTMYLKHLLTVSKFRRQGIAEKLLNKAFFLSKECIRFILWVIETNEPAINLYKKFGYSFEALSNYTYISR